MSLSDLARTRYTTKAFDPAGKVSDSDLQELITLLRYSPSSVNSQPWHFVVAGSTAAKTRIAKAGAQGPYAYNAPKIEHASHVIVLCARTGLPDAQLDAILDQEERDGRFQTPEARGNQRKTRQGFVDLHRYTQKDLQHWMEKQVYLALGTLLLGAATLGIDATPMEGFDAGALDEELNLREAGYTSVVLVGLGYRADSDFNAALPKSRLPAETVVRYL